MKNIGNFKKKQNDLERRIFGCSAHFSDYFLHECNHGGVYAWKAPASTSDQVQALDLGIFGNQKKIKTKFNSDSKLSPTDKKKKKCRNNQFVEKIYMP